MKKVNLLLALLLLFYSCKKEDPCESQNCKNGSTCDNGKCLCEGYWTGEQCDEQTPPNGILVGSIRLSKFPATDTGGAGWDLTSGPDLFVSILVDGNEVLNTQSSFIQNGTVGSFFITGPAFLAYPNSTVTINLFDYDDFDPNDFMGGIMGKVYTNVDGYPTSFQLQCPTCPVWVSLENITYL